MNSEEGRVLKLIFIGTMLTLGVVLGGVYVHRSSRLNKSETPVLANNFVSIERVDHTEILRFRLAEVDINPNILGQKLDSLYNIDPEQHNAFFVKVVTNGQIQEMPVLRIKKNISHDQSGNNHE